ncbi:MAG: 2-dehydropantoate 2-reductase [Cyanobacteria bacterium]|nr:2-dehydropantoate 2-reductase [Cyanobacteriota bacterium]
MSKTKTHFVVLGMGAVGGFYGLRLAKYLQEKPDVYRLSFIARGKTLEALREGATLIDGDEEIKISNLNCFEDFSEIGFETDEQVVVLLCVKSKDTLEACQSLLGDPNVASLLRMAVVSIQNGVENEERIASVLGKERTIGALTNIAAEVLEPGRYINKGKYSLVLGELDGSSSERLDRIMELLRAAGINTRISENIYQELWSKLVWNAGFNPTSVLYQMTVGQLLEKPEIREVIVGVMQEVKQVAHALGYDLADDVDQKHIARTDTPEWYSFRTSMLQDHQNGKPIELDDLLGVVVRKGQKKGINTPYATKLYKDLLV